jgi:RNA polymerase sigma-70 factor, ECF subfamily
MALGQSETERVRNLVERIQARIDYEQSCKDLYGLYFRRVHRFFAGRRFSPDDCEELTQETFVRVFHAVEGLQSASRFPGWLFEIAANTYRNEVRRRHTGKRDAFEEPIEALAARQAAGKVDALAALSSRAPSPLEGALRQERLDSLRTELDQLPPQMRRCVYLRVEQGLKYREIAAVMRISIETVKAHLHQAQKRLKLTFSGRPDGEENQGAL